MSYHEKQAIVSMISSVLITLIYSVYVFQKYLAGNEDLLLNLRFWGWAFLAFILVSIVAKILITIAFTIHYRITTREEEPSFSDERDKLIELKAARNSNYAFSIGVVLSMISLAIGMPLYIMFTLLIYSGLAASVVDDITQFYLYRRGF